MRSNGLFKWWWCRWEELEICHGPHDTREAAIAAARADLKPDEFDDEDPDDDKAFWVVEADKQIVVADKLFGSDDLVAADGAVFHAEQLLEMIAEANEELWSEDGFEGLRDDGVKAAEAELEAAVRECQLASNGVADCVNAAVADWLTRHQHLFPVFTFGVQRNHERIPLSEAA